MTPEPTARAEVTSVAELLDRHRLLIREAGGAEPLRHTDLVYRCSCGEVFEVWRGPATTPDPEFHRRVDVQYRLHVAFSVVITEGPAASAAFAVVRVRALYEEWRGGLPVWGPDDRGSMILDGVDRDELLGQLSRALDGTPEPELTSRQARRAPSLDDEERRREEVHAALGTDGAWRRPNGTGKAHRVGGYRIDPSGREIPISGFCGVALHGFAAENFRSLARGDLCKTCWPEWLRSAQAEGILL